MQLNWWGFCLDSAPLPILPNVDRNLAEHLHASEDKKHLIIDP